MRGHVPQRPTGSDAEAIFAQSVWDRIFGPAGSLRDSSTVHWERTTRGIFAHAAAAGGNGSSAAKEYRLKSVEDDYLVCRSWDGTTDGDTDINIAKPWLLRTSLASRDFINEHHDYSYAAGPDALNLQRNDDDGSSVEVQFITPAWALNDIIYAIPAKISVQDKNGKSITLLMVEDNRHWAAD